MLVWIEPGPAVSPADPAYAAKAPDDVEFLLPIEIIANVVEENPALFLSLRVLDEDRDSDPRHTVLAEDVATFTGLPTGQYVFSDVAPQMKNMNAGELVC